MTKPNPSLVCTGRTWDPRTNQPDGDPCGAVYERRRREWQSGYELRARAAGWAFGPGADKPRSVMCPRCRSPRPNVER